MCKNYQDADLCRATTKLYVTFLVLLGVRLSGEWKWNGMALWILVSNPLKIISWKFETNPSISNFWSPSAPTHPYLRFLGYASCSVYMSALFFYKNLIGNLSECTLDISQHEASPKLLINPCVLTTWLHAWTYYN